MIRNDKIPLFLCLLFTSNFLAQNFCWAQTPQETLASAYAKLGSYQDQARCTRFASTDTSTNSVETAQTFYAADVGPAFKRIEKLPGLERGRVVRLHLGHWQRADWGFDQNGFFNSSGSLDDIDKPTLLGLMDAGAWEGVISPGLLLLYGGFPAGLNPSEYLCTANNLRISCKARKTADTAEFWISSEHVIIRSKRFVDGNTHYCEFAPKSARINMRELDIAVPKALSKIVAWNLKEKVIPPDVLKAALAGDKYALQMLVPWQLSKVDEKLALKLLYMAARFRVPDAETMVANLYQERKARTPNSPAFGMSADAMLKKRIELLQKAASHCDREAFGWLTGNDVTEDVALRTKIRRTGMECYMQALPAPIARPNW